MNKSYELSIDPRILELLGPNLYTNIYYVLAELIANAYDADAHNVYIISHKDNITVEDDGKGMSYTAGDIQKYLNVAAVSRNNDEESFTGLNRRKMGRKGVGKLAALSVSDKVLVKTVCNAEKSGFVLSRHIGDDKKLTPILDDKITFEKITEHGTAIVMQQPQYQLHSSVRAIKRNLLKIFPLVNDDFKIHIYQEEEEGVVDNFDKEMTKELSALITLGDDFRHLAKHFSTPFPDYTNKLLENRPSISLPIEMKDRNNVEKEYDVEIRGWIGAYKTTRGRKAELTDFPDNFISLCANNKLGEFNILPAVGQNKLPEVYVVGQLHIDIFELTELPDMALSNRQGYRTDDPRYQAVREYVRTTLLPDILRKREVFVSLSKKKKKEKVLAQQREGEESLRQQINIFKKDTTEQATEKITSLLGIPRERADEVKKIISEEINSNSPKIGIKTQVDAQKKKILISQTYADKDLADVVYKMLVFNNVLPEEIIYTNCDDEISRIPEGDVGKSGIYNYLRDFFVDSYSTKKIYVIFITSHKTKESWGAQMEIGAAWITQIEHKIFNIYDFRPEHPLDDEQQWHSSCRDSITNELSMNNLSIDIFAQKIEYICKRVGYNPKSRQANKRYLQTLVKEVL